MDDPIFYTKRARDGTRTRDLHLGKVALHQLSHSRILLAFSSSAKKKRQHVLPTIFQFKSSFPNDNSHSIGYVPISQAK